MSQSTGGLDADAGSSATVEERRVNEQRTSGTHKGKKATFGDSREQTESGPDLAILPVAGILLGFGLMLPLLARIWERLGQKKNIAPPKKAGP